MPVLEKNHFGSWHLCFTAAKHTLWVVGAIGFPSAANERLEGDNSKGKRRESQDGSSNLRHVEPDSLEIEINFSLIMSICDFDALQKCILCHKE